MWLFLFCNNTRLLPFHARLRFARASQVHQLHPGTPSVSVADGRLGDVSAAALLLDRRGSSFSMQAVDQRSPVGGRVASAGRIFRHRSIRFGLFEFAAPAPSASGVHRTFTSGVSADAFVPDAVRDERNAGRNSRHSGVYLCLRLLKSEVPRASQFAWLGVALGATILTKVTGILLLPIVIAAVAGRLRSARARSRSRCATSGCWLRFVSLSVAGNTPAFG